MSIADDVTEEEEPRTESENLIGQIKSLREEAKSDHHLDLPIPGYQRLLWGRYRPFPSAKSEAGAAELRKAASRGLPIMLNASIDTIVDACEQIMVLKPEFNGEPGETGENLKPLDDEVPIRYDVRLAELIGYQTRSTRDVVTGLFPTDQSIMAHSITIAQWLQDTTRKVDSGLLGE